MKRGFAIVTGMVLGLSLCSLPAGAERNHGGKWIYKITITNVTKGMDLSQGLVFTPILLATHKPGVNLFELGHGLETGGWIAGDTGYLLVASEPHISIEPFLGTGQRRVALVRPVGMK